VAQLVDLGDGIHEVMDSIPISSTNSSNNLADATEVQEHFVSCLCLVCTLCGVGATQPARRGASGRAAVRPAGPKAGVGRPRACGLIDELLLFRLRSQPEGTQS